MEIVSLIRLMKIVNVNDYEENGIGYYKFKYCRVVIQIFYVLVNNRWKFLIKLMVIK